MRQIRDLYADIYFDKDKEFRVRAGQSKIPYGFENMQSSQNRLALDRADAINTCCKDERDIGLFFYYTPKEMRHLFRDLVKNNLKGSGDYGMVGFGVYNGQGANRIELNKGTHIVARFTYPYVFENGQVVEASVQGYTGRFVPYTAAIRPSFGMATNWAGFIPLNIPVHRHRDRLCSLCEWPRMEQRRQLFPVPNMARSIAGDRSWPMAVRAFATRASRSPA